MLQMPPTPTKLVTPCLRTSSRKVEMLSRGSSRIRPPQTRVATVRNFAPMWKNGRKFITTSSSRKPLMSAYM